jgi:hypothetical protein
LTEKDGRLTGKTTILRRKVRSKKTPITPRSVDIAAQSSLVDDLIDLSTPRKPNEVGAAVQKKAKVSVESKLTPEEEAGFLATGLTWGTDMFAKAASYMGAGNEAAAADENESKLHNSPMKKQVLDIFEEKVQQGSVRPDEVDDHTLHEIAGELNVLDRINMHLRRYAMFRFLQKKTGFEEFEILFAICAIWMLAVVVIFGPRVLCNCVAFVYPCYASYKTLENYTMIYRYVYPFEEDSDEEDGDYEDTISTTKRGSNKQDREPGATEEQDTEDELALEGAAQDMRVWLTYWTCLGVFGLVEFLADFLLFWMAYYEFLKMVFLLWLFIPRTDGSKIGSAIVYRRVVEPALLYLEPSIDAWLADVGRTGSEAFDEMSSVASEYLSLGVAKVFSMMATSAQSSPPEDVTAKRKAA